MQKNARRLSGRIVAFGVSAAIMFSGMTMDIQAKESTGLPSAGIDFYLASDGTSVKNLKDQKDETGSACTCRRYGMS